MKILLLEGLPVASLVGAEAFVAGFSLIWAVFSAIGLGDIAVIAAFVAGGAALTLAVWAIYIAMHTTRNQPPEPLTD